MVNTLHGPFVPGGSTASGHYGTGGGQVNTYTSGNVNYDETQAAIALHSFNPYLISSGYVHSGATCTKDGTVASQLDIASGEAWLIQSDGTLALCDIAADNTHTTTGNPSTTMYLYLQPDGSWYWNTANTPAANSLFMAQVVTDASANIATVTDKRPLSTTFLSPAQGLHVGQPGAAGSGVTQAFLRLGGAVGSYLNDSYIGTYADVAGGGGAFLYLVLAADKGIIFTQQGIGGGNLFAVGLTPTAGVKSWIDQSGGLHATAPVTLVAGNQETGFAGFRAKTAVVGDIVGVGVNFKTVMSNTPTSIGETIVSASNTSVVSILNVTKYGFSLEGPSTSTGGNFAYIEYTTVGNCLLAVDAAAATFDHHCDKCRAVHRSVPLAQLALYAGATPGASDLSYTCPDCGYREHFTCGLSADDEADSTPQGSGEYATTRGAQAALIRQLMSALGLAVVA